MKLDMGQAWNAATYLIGKNVDMILIIAGVFIFLPTLALTLLIPGLDQSAADPSDTDAILGALLEVYRSYWWAFIISGLVQAVGTLSLLTLLTDTSRPTVGEALKLGIKGILSYFVTQILIGLATAVVIGVPLGIAVASNITPLAVMIGLVALVAIVYISIKTMLIAPIIAIEREYNPIAIVKRSWGLTKGNSVRLLAFFALLFIAIMVVSLVVEGILSVILALMGGQVQIIGMAIVSGILNTVLAVVVLAVLAGVHGQLAGPDSDENLTDTFA